MSGAILRRGSAELREAGSSVLQMHTYSGSSMRALMAGKAVLETMPLWFGHVERLGKLCSSIFAAVQEAGCGTLVCHGQGLMWGALFTYHEPSRRQQAMDVLKHHCRGSDDRLLQNDEITAAADGQDNAIWPYFVPAGGIIRPCARGPGDTASASAGRPVSGTGSGVSINL